MHGVVRSSFLMSGSLLSYLTSMLSGGALVKFSEIIERVVQSVSLGCAEALRSAICGW